MLPIKFSIFYKVLSLEIFYSVVIEEKPRFSLDFRGFLWIFWFFAFSLMHIDFFDCLSHYNDLFGHFYFVVLNELARRFCLVRGSYLNFLLLHVVRKLTSIKRISVNNFCLFMPREKDPFYVINMPYLF
jgi:hypothetical protein